MRYKDKKIKKPLLSRSLIPNLKKKKKRRSVDVDDGGS